MSVVVVGMVVDGGRTVALGVTAGGISSGLNPRRISLRWTVWPVCLSTSTACWLVYPWIFTPSTYREGSFVSLRTKSEQQSWSRHCECAEMSPEFMLDTNTIEIRLIIPIKDSSRCKQKLLCMSVIIYFGNPLYLF